MSIGAQGGAHAYDPKTITQAKTNTWLLYQLSHPGTPISPSLFFFFLRFVFICQRERMHKQEEKQTEGEEGSPADQVA